VGSSGVGTHEQPAWPKNECLGRGAGEQPMGEEGAAVSGCRAPDSRCVGQWRAWTRACALKDWGRKPVSH
jgi:hypothetical protein